MTLYHQDEQARRSDGLVALCAKLIAIYLAIVFISGTMRHSTNDATADVGAALQQATFIEPAIDWADDQGFSPVAKGLRVLANGVPFDRVT